MLVSLLVPLVSAALILASDLAMRSFCRAISETMRSILAVPSVAAAVCSTWALLKKPKMPMLVININTATAGTRYSLIHQLACFQYSFNQTAPVSLPDSNTPPMITTGQKAAANIAVRPTML